MARETDSSLRVRLNAESLEGSARLPLQPCRPLSNAHYLENTCFLPRIHIYFSEQNKSIFDPYLIVTRDWLILLAAILLQSSSKGYAPKNAGLNQSTTIVSFTTTGALPVPNGPYFLSSTGGLYQPYRLYTDFAGSFTQALVPTSNESYAALPASIPGIESPTIGVPSRLYYTKTPSKPLAGVRTGIKDIYDIAGVKTSDGNRAWYGFYPPATENSVPVQLLVDAGAVIVGKMKTSQFANGERATADWVDYHSPFNPRGDGYQDPSSSSSGPGAGAGTYPWLDLTLGSDTGGSIRGPSQVQGLFGNRPTHDLVELTGTMPLAPELDTAGFLSVPSSPTRQPFHLHVADNHRCRDPTIHKAAGQALYPNLPFSSSYPTRIQTLNFPTNASTPAASLILSFLSSLQSFLNATTPEPLNLTEAWSATKPPSAPSTLTELLNTTYPILITKQQTRLVRDPFFAAYAAVHDGRLPFIDPAPSVRWAYADTQPNSSLIEARDNKTVFMDWFNTNILPTNDTEETCSENILLYSANSEAPGVDPRYRDFYKDPPTVPFGFGTSRISVFAEVPDYVVPVGEASYESEVTNHTEVLPVTVDLLVGRGCDGMVSSLPFVLFYPLL